MRKTILLIIATAVIAASSCTNSPKREQLISKNDSLRAEIEQRDAVLEEMIGTINLIEQGFRSISEAQGRINLDDAISSEKSRAEILQNDIDFISETLAKNKAEIQRLQSQIKNNKTASKQLQTMIENLQNQLMQKSRDLETMQAALAEKNIHIEKLDKTISELSKTNETNERIISIQDSELNSVWYAIGTKRELKEQKILKSGDVLRETDANLDYFTKADLRELTQINTYAGRAKLLTNHPANSYKLERNSDKQYILTITNPDAFWSTTRYLVIQVR